MICATRWSPHLDRLEPAVAGNRPALSTLVLLMQLRNIYLELYLFSEFGPLYANGVS